MRRTLRIGCMALCMAALYASSAAADSPEEARLHFKAGVRHLQDPDGARYEDAYREFRAAYAASPNPKILANLGYCAMKLERDGEAIAAYTRYLNEATEIEPDERETISKDLMTMRAGLVRLTLGVEQGAALTIIDTRTPVSGTPVVNTYGPISGNMEVGLRPGHHILRARTQNGEESKPWELDASPGAKHSHVFVVVKEEPKKPKSPLPRSADEPQSSRAVPWLITGLGGAMLIGAATTGVLVMTRVSRLESKCPNDTCPAGSGLDAERDTTKRLMRATDFLLVGGGVLTTTGVLWLLLSGDDKSSEKARTTLISKPLVACSGEGCMLAVWGRF